MKNLTFLAVLLVLAGLAYEFGRRYRGRGDGRGTDDRAHPIVETTPSLRAAAESESDQVELARRSGGINPAAPFAQNTISAQRGYEAARSDLEAALKQIESLPVPERM